MKTNIKTCFLALAALVLPMGITARDAAVKTNLLYDAALSPNLGVEVELAPRWSADISGNVNAWSIDNRSWKHWLVQPEVRYWLCESFNGHFLGFHLLGGEYNIRNLKLPFKTLPRTSEGRHYEGWFIGAGIAYGYQWMLSRHWSIEAEIGLGYAYSPYRLYGTCERCLGKDRRHYVGPTKLAVSLLYVF